MTSPWCRLSTSAVVAATAVVADRVVAVLAVIGVRLAEKPELPQVLGDTQVGPVSHGLERDPLQHAGAELLRGRRRPARLDHVRRRAAIARRSPTSHASSALL